MDNFFYEFFCLCMDDGCVEREHFNQSRSMFAVPGERRTWLRVALSSLETLRRLLPIDAGRNGEKERDPHSVGLRNRRLCGAEWRTSQHPRCLQSKKKTFFFFFYIILFSIIISCCFMRVSFERKRERDIKARKE